MEIASGVIFKEQHAMLKGRSIDEAVELVYDFFFFFFEVNFIQLIVLNLSHLNYIKLCLFF